MKFLLKPQIHWRLDVHNSDVINAYCGKHLVGRVVSNPIEHTLTVCGGIFERPYVYDTSAKLPPSEFQRILSRAKEYLERCVLCWVNELSINFEIQR